MQVVRMTGDLERVVLYFDAEVSAKAGREPQNYWVAGQRPGRVEVVGSCVFLSDLRLSPKRNAVAISEAVTDIHANPVAEESRKLTFVPKYRRRKVRVTAVQPLRITETAGGYTVYLDYVMGLVDEAGRLGSDIVCLPESVQYQPGKAKPDMFEPVSGVYPQMLMERARKYQMYVVAPLYERRGEALYNVALIIDRQGEIAGRYQKIFVTEGAKVIPGEGFDVFETDFGVIGVMICFDILYPEGPAIMALRGAEVVFFPHGIGGVQTSEDLVVSTSRVRATDNGVYVVPSGFGRRIDRGEGNFGRSCVIDPSGVILADAGHGPGLASVVVDLEAVRFVEGYGGPARFNVARDRLICERRADILQELADVARDRCEEMWYHRRYGVRGERKLAC